MKEIQRYYVAKFNAAGTFRTMSFRADNKQLAHDHASHVARDAGIGEVHAVHFIGRTEPQDCGVIKAI
jgi:hypothetical protein